MGLLLGITPKIYFQNLPPRFTPKIYFKGLELHRVMELLKAVTKGKPEDDLP